MKTPRGVVWITGASSGIGRDTALLLACNGWKVAASARGHDGLEKLAGHHQAIHPFPLDVTDPVARREVHAGIKKELGPVDVMVNNAGYAVRGAVEEISAGDTRELFDVNVFAPIALTRLVLPEMRERRTGRIIMVSSVVGKVAFPLNGTYSAAKFALEGFSDALRIETAPWGIDVILVEPGPIATQFQGTAKRRSIGILLSRQSPYREYYRKYLGGGFLSKRIYWGPVTVARVIAEAAESERPRVRYPVHPIARWLPVLAKIIPARWLDFILGGQYGLHRSTAGQPPL